MAYLLLMAATIHTCFSYTCLLGLIWWWSGKIFPNDTVSCAAGHSLRSFLQLVELLKRGLVSRVRGRLPVRPKTVMSTLGPV